MNQQGIDLMKTLCAMNWIAQLNGNYRVSALLKRQIDDLEASQCAR
jgi:hypothetical protein